VFANVKFGRQAKFTLAAEIAGLYLFFRCTSWTISERILEFRGDQNDKYDQIRKTIFDVANDDLMKDSVNTVRRIYNHFGLRWPHEFKMVLEAWLHDNPQGKQGRNAYSLSDFNRYVPSSIKLISVVFGYKRRTIIIFYWSSMLDVLNVCDPRPYY